MARVWSPFVEVKRLGHWKDAPLHPLGIEMEGEEERSVNLRNAVPEVLVEKYMSTCSVSLSILISRNSSSLLSTVMGEEFTADQSGMVRVLEFGPRNFETFMLIPAVEL